MAKQTQRDSELHTQQQETQDGEEQELKIPLADDILNANSVFLEQHEEAKCRVVLCHACGLKDHNYDPHDYFVPCDHPWALAPTGAQLIEITGRGKGRLMTGKGDYLTTSQVLQAGGRKECSCF